MFDLLIKGGRVVDGTGAPARLADVAVTDGRIVEIGAIDGPARRTLDARGKIVSPGFVDVHTHYDAQVFWDPTLSPSCYHGVTSIFGGNCGFSIAPLSPEAAPYLRRMLARVEGMPEVSLKVGAPWNWRSFGEYLDRLEGRVGVNVGFMCGHSAIRRVVMGERAVGERATPEDMCGMSELLLASLTEGALGFSTTISRSHNDGEGQPVPSRYAEPGELIALAAVCGKQAGASLEISPGNNPFTEEEVELMTAMSVAAQRPINWNPLYVKPGNEATIANHLAASDYARARGGRIVPLVMVAPATMRLNFHSGFVFDVLDGWAEIFQLPVHERIGVLKDPARRRDLERRGQAENPRQMGRYAQWDQYVVAACRDDALVGATVGEIAGRSGKAPLDAMLDLAIAEDLRTVFTRESDDTGAETWRRRADLWRDKRTIIGASDAGAHLDMLDAFAFSTTLLAEARDRQLLTLEEAVHQLTQAPAEFIGLKERGVLAPGWLADIVVFDAGVVGPGDVHVRRDLPCGEVRLYADAQGVEFVVVGGIVTVEHGAHTGELPGRVLRSGRDTYTPALDA